MAEDTREEREARWWRDWFDTDYSWDGLGQKSVRGGGKFAEVTLQDYWRRDPGDSFGLRSPRTNEDLIATGELVEFDGRWWHLAHLPPRGPGGVESWKADLEAAEWQQLNGLLAVRLAVAAKAVGRFEWDAGANVWISEGADGRAMLDGAVLRHDSIQANLLALSCRRAAFVGGLELSGRAFSDGADFSDALFDGITGFQSTTFSGDVRFHSANFSGDVCFDNAAFSGSNSFESATLSGDVFFRRATFSGDVSFDAAKFSGETRFFSAKFKTEALFRRAAFLGDAFFDDAVFSGDARFVSVAMFGSASFRKSVFSSDAAFHDAAFSREAIFSNVAFGGRAGFDAAAFLHPTHFNGAAFKGPAYFSGTFKATTQFENAVFEGPLTFKATITEPERDFSRTFYGARFAGIADFSSAVGEGQGGRMVAAFAEAQFEKALILTDGLDGRTGLGLQKALLSKTLVAADCDLAFELGRVALACPPKVMAIAEQVAFLSARREERFAALESGGRVVKIAMGKARDEVREQAYYRLQLRARHQRHDIDGWEKFAGWIYGATSDFGSSLWRPLVWLGLLVLVFAVVIYWPWMAWLNIRDAHGPGGVFVALNHSLRTLSPFNLLTSPGMITAMGAPTSLSEVNPAVTFGARMVSGLQSILSTLLIFLFGLAVKRRFQIS